MNNFRAFSIVILFSFILISCKNDGGKTDVNDDSDVVVASKDKIVYSFAFTGCNRVGWSVLRSQNPSMANHVALDSIFSDMMRQNPKPELFFNLGDIVRAEANVTDTLSDQLKAWLVDSAVVEFTRNSGIEMVALPGNHELLQSVDEGPEYPLPGSTQVWLNYMSKFMPSDREIAPDTLSLDNRSSFSFVRDSIGFIVLNTDTYNPPATGQTYGKEGQFPQDWAIAKIEEFASDPAIKQIYAFGHRPYYIKGSVPPPSDTHSGLPNAEPFWKAMSDNGVIAYLAAHKHDYQRYQHNNQNTTQIIAGNAGSKLDHGVDPGGFYGYSLIQIYASGKTRLITRGYCMPNRDDYLNPAAGPMKVRDTSWLNVTGNSNPLTYPYRAAACSD